VARHLLYLSYGVRPFEERASPAEVTMSSTKIQVLAAGRSWRGVCAVVAIHGLLAVTAAAAGEAKPPRSEPSTRPPAANTARDTSRSMLDPDGFTSAEICSGCHKAIHAAWTDSVHARSFTAPAFAAALAEASRKGGKDARRRCLTCHAPTTLLTGDLEAKDPITSEGITCSFCHSIKAAEITWKDQPFTLEPGQTMRGPFQYAVSPGHDTLYSPLHRTATLCAPCHQYVSPKGVAVLNTYEEWREGPYPSQGVQCQDCHMALVRGATAETIPKPALPTAQDARLINLHRLVGGSSLGQLRRALSARVRETKRAGGSIRAVVDVRNDAAGHRAPTGLPTRSIVLRIEATRDGKPFHTEERVYRREVFDADGRRIVSDGDVFQSAARVGADTRLGPGETRAEVFNFAAPPGEARLAISLDYVARGDPGSSDRVLRFFETAVDVK
jgi:hypothetical protein